MVSIVGKYEFENAGNIDDYLAQLGVGHVLRRVRQVAKPTLEIVFSPDTDEWSITTDSAFNSHKVTFKLGAPVEDKTYDARQCLTIGRTLGEDKIFLDQKCEDGPDVNVAIEKVSHDLLKITHNAGPHSLGIFFRKQG